MPVQAALLASAIASIPLSMRQSVAARETHVETALVIEAPIEGDEAAERLAASVV